MTSFTTLLRTPNERTRSISDKVQMKKASISPDTVCQKDGVPLMKRHIDKVKVIGQMLQLNEKIPRSS